MKIESFDSLAGTQSAKGNGGSDAQSIFGAGVAGEQKSFSAHMLALCSRQNVGEKNKERGPESDAARHDDATDCVRSSAELVAMTSAQPLERHEVPKEDASTPELTDDLPPVQSSAQLSTQSCGQSESTIEAMASVGGSTEGSPGTDTTVPASEPAEADPAAMPGGFPQMTLPEETEDETLQGAQTPDLSKDSTAADAVTVNLAAGETAAQQTAPEKNADPSGNADKHRLRSLAGAVGTHSAKPQRSMTDDPKSTLPEPSLTPTGEEAARPSVMTRSEGQSMQDQGDKRGFSDQEPRAESNQGFRIEHTATPEIRTFEASQPLPPVQAPAMQVVTTTSRGFEPVFKALGEVVEKMRVQGPNKVEMELQLDSGEKLLVRLEMRQGTVHAAFRSETGGFQQALQQGWSQFAQQSSERGVNVADAKFEMNSSDSQASLDQQSSRDRAHDGAGAQQRAPRVFSSSARQGAQQTSLKANQGTQGDNSGVSLWA